MAAFVLILAVTSVTEIMLNKEEFHKHQKLQKQNKQLVLHFMDILYTRIRCETLQRGQA